MEKVRLVRALYLYVAAIIGLILVISSAITFINLGLKTFIFTKADMDYYGSRPMVSKERLQEVGDSQGLSAEQKQAISEVVAEYEGSAQKDDYIVGQRQREASNALAMLIVGLALYLFHWRIVQKENKKS